VRANAGPTAEVLAKQLHRPLFYVEELMRESEAAGIVERNDDGWRLTERAERQYGAALRGLTAA
jgi:hypothetical protein